MNIKTTVTKLWNGYGHLVLPTFVIAITVCTVLQTVGISLEITRLQGTTTPSLPPSSSSVSSTTSSLERRRIWSLLTRLKQRIAAGEMRRAAAPFPSLLEDIAQASAPTAMEEMSFPPLANTKAFPAFSRTVFPVSRIPNWGAMRTSTQWNQSYDAMDKSKFIAVPAYNLSELTVPLRSITTPLRNEYITILTAKLFYSTRFFGVYDLDSQEFQARHAGIDLKLPYGMPIGTIAGGRVHALGDTGPFGKHIIIEHRAPDGKVYFSIYGHLSRMLVTAGENVIPGETIGTVGMTGETTNPHLHLQVDRKVREGTHVPYWPATVPTPAEADQWTVHPIRFIEEFTRG